jgi:hypothetical protein
MLKVQKQMYTVYSINNVTRVNIKEVEKSLAGLVKKAPLDLSFIYSLLLAYGKPPASITRLKNGTYNLAKDKSTEIYWKSNLFFKYVEHEDLHGTIDDLKSDQFVNRHSPRFIVVTDFSQLLAIDTKTEETLDIPINEINKHFVFFLPWAGMEKSQHKTENIADIKAAERMAKLYDEIIKYNESNDATFYHALNVFFSRLLFCFFAEDTEVFAKSQFTNSIASHTQSDGSDLSKYLNELFKAMDVEDKSSYPSYIKAFPYVNGRLFNREYAAPKFNAQARRLIIECGELDWAQINPDIFGSMIQAVVHPGQRSGLGMHYTSVINIMKVIEPLFLEDLLEEFDKSLDDEKRLIKLLHRIYSIKVFDPACGSGNFLIIAYKELRKLEHRILERLLENKLAVKINSGLKLENFYGIEIDDFAHEVAILSLWLAKHQMNLEFKQRFGKDIPLIPLKDTGNVVCNNAARVDWETICPATDEDEVYLIGNPPYLGGKLQNTDQKKDKDIALAELDQYKDLDYIAIWFVKASNFIKKRGKYAFVTTNSLFQGTQVPKLWPRILSKNQEIFFAYKNFKWSNNAKRNAGVICSIVGIRKIDNRPKYLFEGSVRQAVDNINPYLVPASNKIISSRSTPLSDLPMMYAGNSVYDEGNLILETQDKNELIETYPQASKLIMKLAGSREYINHLERWCLWIENSDLELAMSIPPIRQRIENVRKIRLAGGVTAKSCANRPHQFYLVKKAKKMSIIIPRVSSERRMYIPMGILDADTIVLNSAYAIFDPELYVFGVINSGMHMAWTKLLAGRLKSDYRYSTGVNYNTFPFPRINEKQKQMITNHVFEVLDARERHSENTLAELYDPNKMPEDLREAHRGLDEVVELCYRSRPFENDDERLAYLFRLYETMNVSDEETN